MSTIDHKEVPGGVPTETPPQDNQALLRMRTNNLPDLLSGITEDNQHTEQDTGEPQGNERW